MNKLHQTASLTKANEDTGVTKRKADSAANLVDVLQKKMMALEARAKNLKD